MHEGPIKVMLVDDSAVVRQALTKILAPISDIDVIGSAMDPIFALEKMKKNWPDVIILDLEMPRMDGLSFLKKIMAKRPTAVIICSTLTLKGSETTMQALSAGAIDIVNKPVMNVKGFLEDSSESLIRSIRAAAQANPTKIRQFPQSENNNSEARPLYTADVMLPAGKPASLVDTTDKIIAIGTSTGGTQALEYILPKLPRTSPGIAIVQHMPEKFTKSFANRLNSFCQVEVKEAEDGDLLLPGTALIAPGGRHMIVRQMGGRYSVEVKDGPMVNRHRPSVDVLFRSVAKAAGQNALGVIMTGMGSDGAAGMKEMFDAKALTIAQDEASSIVYGMPKEAVLQGGVSQVLSLQEIPKQMLKAFTRH